MPGNDSEKKVSFKFFKMSTVSLMTSLLTEDCSRFSPPRHRTLDHRLFEDVSVAQKDLLMKIGDMAQAVTQIRRGKTPQTPKCQYCQLERYSLRCRPYLYLLYLQ